MKKVTAKVLASCRCVRAYENTNALQTSSLPKLKVMYEYTKLLGFFSLVFEIIIKESELTAKSSATITTRGNDACMYFAKTK
jgi:hypothetical protein